MRRSLGPRRIRLRSTSRLVALVTVGAVRIGVIRSVIAVAITAVAIASGSSDTANAVTAAVADLDAVDADSAPVAGAIAVSAIAEPLLNGGAALVDCDLASTRHVVAVAVVAVAGHSVDDRTDHI